MAVKFVRAPSETPNINNIDDFTGLRYTYCDVDGFVKDKGNEIGYEINGSTFTVKSGRLVLQGTETDIDSNGVDIVVDNVSTLRYYTIYLKVNLATNTAEILSQYDTAGYPNIAKGDNLTSNTSGYAQLELYKFTAQNAIISNVAKLVKVVDYGVAKTTVDFGYITNDTTTDKAKSLIFGDSNGFGLAGDWGYWKLWAYPDGAEHYCALVPSRANVQNLGVDGHCVNKVYTNDVMLRANNGVTSSLNEKINSINARLDNLGFKQGSVSISSGGTATINTLKRQGNYVIGTLLLKNSSIGANAGIRGTFPENFRPPGPRGVAMYGSGTVVDAPSIKSFAQMVIASSGDFIVYLPSQVEFWEMYFANFGFEASPI